MARILLGVSGGIAAYKALEFIRLASGAGHSLRVVQTPTSQRFVGEASFAALTGAPGAWDPTSIATTLLPGFKVAAGPNEYGEWAATGTWTGATAVVTGTAGVTITDIIDFGLNPSCTLSCPTGQIADSVTKACVAPCSDGSAPASGVCPPPVKGTGPVTPPAAAAATSTTSAGTVVAVVGGVGVLGALAYLAFIE